MSIVFSFRHRLRTWKGLVLLAVLLFGATAGVIFAMQNGQSDAEKQGELRASIVAYSSVEEMASRADAVVIVTFTGDFVADDHVRPNDASNLQDGPDVEYLERVRSAQVVEALHGPHVAGDTIAVVRAIRGSFTLRADGFEIAEESWDVGDWPDVDSGTEYLLFLSEKPARSEWGLPPSFDAEWVTLGGTPQYGLVEEDFVTFVHRPDFSEEVLQRLDQPDGPLSEIREAVERGAAGEGVGLSPAEQEEADRLLRRGQALEQLVEDAQSMESVDAVRDRAFELELDAASLEDPAFCRKVIAVVAGETGHQLDLACDGP